MDRKLQIILMIAFALNSFLMFSNFQNRTYDSLEHIFFADHYRNSWFDTWEPKWYGGFPVTSYPPLAHQTIALMSYVVGLEWSYKILTLTIMSLLPLAIFLFAKVFVSESAAIYSSFISIFLPALLQTSYSFGQFPTIFSLIAALLTIVFLNKFLQNNNPIDLILSLSLIGVSVSSHHFTAVFFIPYLVIVLTLNLLIRKHTPTLKTIFKRVLLFSILGVAVCLIVIYPYWTFSFTNAVNAPIPHLSRINIFSDLYAFKLFFWNVYGPIIFLIPSIGVLCARRKALIPVVVGAFVMLVLGLGGASPLPEIMFGKSWEVLTYDRFALWAVITFLPLIGLLFEENKARIISKKFYGVAVVGFFVFLILSGAYAANNDLNTVYPVSIANVDPIIEFLNSPVTQNWRYLTLGLGEPAMLKVNLYSSAKSIDGYYFFVRRDPLLSQSQIGQLDSAKYYGERGINILTQVLGNATKYSLRWVVCADPTYYSILVNNSFVKMWSQDITGDGRYGGLTIWECTYPVPEYVASRSKNDSPLADNILWGILPPLMLLTSIVAIVVKYGKKRDNLTKKVGVLARKK